RQLRAKPASPLASVVSFAWWTQQPTKRRQSRVFLSKIMRCKHSGMERRDTTQLGSCRSTDEVRGTGNAYADEWLPCVISGKFNENQMRKGRSAILRFRAPT